MDLCVPSPSRYEIRQFVACKHTATDHLCYILTSLIVPFKFAALLNHYFVLTMEREGPLLSCGVGMGRGGGGALVKATYKGNLLHSKN